jgi:transcriptional regulator with XRE-family HTH domain
MDIGEKIRLLRKEKGWTQTKLATESGISLPYLNQIEKGKAGSVSDDILTAIAHRLGISLLEVKEISSGFKVAFTPSAWSVPLLSILVNDTKLDADIFYWRNAQLPQSIDHGTRDTNYPGNLDLRTISGKLYRQREDEKEKSIKIISEKDLLRGLVNQDYDLVFAPNTNNYETGFTAIANICSTIQGNITALVFATDAISEKRLISDNTSFLNKYKDQKNWEELVEHSVFYYQQDSIAQFVVNEIFDNLSIPSNRRIEILDDNIESLRRFTLRILGKNNRGEHRKDKDDKLEDEDLYSSVNNTSRYTLAELLDNKKNSVKYLIYIGWEPYISNLIFSYTKQFPGKHCIPFDINQFLEPGEPLFFLNYDCFIKAEKLDSIKKNEAVRKFFLALNVAVKRMVKYSQSKSINPEIEIIAGILEMDPREVLNLIKRINFSLKFYPDWIL